MNMVYQIIHSVIKAVERVKKPYDTEIEITFSDGSTLILFDPNGVLKIRPTN